MPVPHPMPGAVLLGHGSREPGAETEIRALTASLADAEPEWRFTHAFLNQEPSLEDAVGRLAKAGCSIVRVIPLLVFTGKHLVEDIPKEVARLRAVHPFIDFEVEPHLSRLSGFTGLVIEALRADLFNRTGSGEPRS